MARELRDFLRKKKLRIESTGRSAPAALSVLDEFAKGPEDPNRDVGLKKGETTERGLARFLKLQMLDRPIDFFYRGASSMAKPEERTLENALNAGIGATFFGIPGGYHGTSPNVAGISKLEIFDRMIRGFGLKGELKRNFQSKVATTPAYGDKLKTVLKRMPEEVVGEGLDLKDLGILSPKDYPGEPSWFGHYVSPRGNYPVDSAGRLVRSNNPRILLQYKKHYPLLGENSIFENLIHEGIGGHHLEKWMRDQAFGTQIPKVLSKEARENVKGILAKRRIRREHLLRGKLEDLNLGSDAEEFAESAVQLLAPEGRGVGFRGTTGRKSSDYKITSESMKDVRDLLIKGHERRINKAFVKAAEKHRKGIPIDEKQRNFLKEVWLKNMTRNERDKVMKMVMPNANK